MSSIYIHSIRLLPKNIFCQTLIMHAEHCTFPGREAATHDTGDTFRQMIDQQMGNMNVSAATSHLVRVLSQGGIYLASFLQDESACDFKCPSQMPIAEDYADNPEVKMLTEQYGTLSKAMINVDDDDAEEERMRKQQRTIRASRKSMIDNLHAAETKKWQDHIAICFALRKLGQMQADLFMKQVRGCCPLSLSLSNYQHDTHYLHQAAKEAAAKEAAAKEAAAKEAAKEAAAKEAAAKEAAKEAAAKKADEAAAEKAKLAAIVRYVKNDALSVLSHA